MNGNKEITLNSSLEWIKDAFDDIKEATNTENEVIENIAQALYDLAHPSIYNVKTFDELQEISNPRDGVICHIYNQNLLKFLLIKELIIL